MRQSSTGQLGPQPNRRDFLYQSVAGLSLGAASSRLAFASPTSVTSTERKPHFAPRAKRVIFLFMLGGPSQFETFENKPKLNELDGQPISEELQKQIKFAQITEQRPSLLGTRIKFARYGECGAEVSELLPHTARIVDDIAILKTMQAEEIPHHPAEIFLHTGTRFFGRPSMGAWINYALGSESADLPGNLVLQSGMRPRTKGNIYGSGFLSTAYQGIPLRDGADPILNLSPPQGQTQEDQHDVINAVQRLNSLRQQLTLDPETRTRNESYRIAERLGVKAEEATSLSQETPATLAAYGVDPTRPSFARNCLLARRMIERGVRFVHLCHGDWDHHTNLMKGMSHQCQQTDQACATLIHDLKQRGLLEDTLVIWGGEFGRSSVGQKSTNAEIGRDHQISAFTMWLAGGGIRGGQTIGATDELGLFPVTPPVSVHDLHATMLHLMGLDHRQLTHHYQGRDFRLTDVAGKVVRELIA